MRQSVLTASEEQFFRHGKVFQTGLDRTCGLCASRGVELENLRGKYARLLAASQDTTAKKAEISKLRTLLGLKQEEAELLGVRRMELESERAQLRMACGECRSVAAAVRLRLQGQD